jgi:nitric-oxide synthase, brain
VAVYPENRKVLVDGILKRLTGLKDPDAVVQLQVLNNRKDWVNHGKLPAASVRTLLTRFLDIATPPTRTMLGFLADHCTDEKDKDRMLMLANVRTFGNVGFEGAKVFFSESRHLRRVAPLEASTLA